jgi:tetratricopeptide (TPR) repeat protein
MELRNSGHVEDAIREAKILLARSTDDDEKASLLASTLVFCCTVGRLGEARRMLRQLQQLEISDLEVRLNAEFCEPCLLIQEGKPEDGISAFAGMLERYGETLKAEPFRYLHEDIQCRRALALFDLSRFTEALPILREAVAYSFQERAAEQRIHFALGVCSEETNDVEAAKKEFFGVIAFNLKNGLEERARYRLARLLVSANAFAHAKKQLEMILAEHPTPTLVVPLEYIYEQLSQVCQHLGDHANAERYADLAKGTRKGKRGTGKTGGKTGTA